MKFTKLLLSIMLLVITSMFSHNDIKAINGAGVYGGGPFYYNRDYAIDELRGSGFKWVCVWTIHVMNENGDLNFNAEFPIVKNGAYIGESKYPHFDDDMAMLKTAPTSIEWIEFGLSAWQSSTFDYIKTLVETEGTGPGSKLYENFKALKEAIPEIDAISFDDEKTYDAPSATQFAVMLADLGYKVSVCPYTATSFWQSVVSNTNNQRPGTIEDVHLQCYAGGSGNNPCTWENYFATDINVMPGVEDGNSIGSYMSNWNNQCGIKGGWIWLYDDFKNNPSLTQQYAAAITNNISQDPTNPPSVAINPNPAHGATDVNISTSLSWTAGNNTTSHKIYFGTSSSPAYQGTQSGTTFNPGSLEINTTYYWKIDEVNSIGTTTGTVWSFTTEATSSTDHTDPVGTGTVTARAEINSNEGAEKAFDNLYANGTQNSDWSKWLDNGGIPSSSSPSWIQIQLPASVVVNKLAIISANDDYGRDPEDFNLQASNNGSNWTTIGSWSGETWGRFERKDFSINNSASYSYYRLNITKNDDNVDMTQLCEIMLFGPGGSTSNCINSLPYNQSFENGIGSFVQESGDNLDWTRQSGSTSSYYTGPSGAEDGSYYMYIEASGNGTGYPNKTANLTSPCFDLSATSSPQLNFSYHMYGSSMGTLNIQVSTNGGSNWTTIWTKSGDQGSNWNSINVDLSSYKQSDVKIRFNGTTGSGYTSDVCIDNFQLTDTRLKATEEAIAISQKQEIKKFITYPNPADNFITIESATSIKSVIVRSIEGKTVQNIKATNNLVTTELSGLKPGIYILTVVQEDGTIINKKIVKK